jgi:hypothetical protein
MKRAVQNLYSSRENDHLQETTSPLLKEESHKVKSLIADKYLMKPLILIFLIFTFKVFASEARMQDPRLIVYYEMLKQKTELEDKIAQKKRLRQEVNSRWNNFWSPGKTKKILDRIDAEIISAHMQKFNIEEQLKKMQEEIKIQMWKRFANGTFELIESNLGSAFSILCPITSDGDFQFFENEGSYLDWDQHFGNEEAKLSFFSNRPGTYVNSCLRQIPEGSSTTVNSQLRQLCKKVSWGPDIIQGTNVNYQVAKKNGRIVISTSIAFNYQGDKENKEEAFKQVEDSIPCMQEFFARHGIQLELTIMEGTPNHGCDHNINLHDHYARPNAGNWAIYGTAKGTLSASSRCAVNVHELSHKLGLADTYPDPDCPSRDPIGPLDDVMHQSNPISAAKLYPEAIQQILGPLCDQ